MKSAKNYWSVIILLVSLSSVTSLAQESKGIVEFDRLMSQLHRDLKIPGMSVVLSQEDSILFEKGYGYDDLRQLIKAEPGTCYKIASLSKPIAAYLLMLYQQRGIISLSDKASDFDISFRNSSDIRLYHILSHSSEGEPGKRFHYNGYRFGSLDSVFVSVSGLSYASLLSRDVIEALSLNQTAPGTISGGIPIALDDPNYVNIVDNLTKYYSLDEKGQAREVQYPQGFGPSAGLVSSALDYMHFLQCQDNLLAANTQNNMYQIVEGRKGNIIPYGMGWFVQDFKEHHFAWHYGWNPPGVSAMVIQDRTSGLKLVVMANTDVLSRPFELKHGDFLKSPLTQVFLRTMVFQGEEVPELVAYERESEIIIDKLKGEKPFVSFLSKIGIWVIFLFLLSALILWPLAWLLRKPWNIKHRKLFINVRYGKNFTFFRYYGVVMIVICLMISGMLSQEVELMYWTDFPGIIAGAAIYQNVFIALPSLLGILLPLQLIWTIIIWTGKYGTSNWRIQYSLVSLALIAYLAFLINWNLVNPAYYAFWLF